MEELSGLRLTSTKKKHRDDTQLTPSQLPHADLMQGDHSYMHHLDQLNIPVFNLDPAYNDTAEILKLKELRERVIGNHGLFAEMISKSHFPPRVTPYSVTLISAVAYDGVVANQLVEGGVDATVFEHSLWRTMEHVRVNNENGDKRVVLLMDNAAIHRHALAIDCALKMKAVLMFNPPYSPHLNPVELLFKRLKTRIRESRPRTR